MGRWILGLLAGLLIGLACVMLSKTDNVEMGLLDAFILVNLHDGLSDWGLEQMDQLLDDAAYDMVPMG